MHSVIFQTNETIDFLSGEFSNRNNRQDVYVEVIDGKEKILLLALAPHPDVKALKSIIEKNENYVIRCIKMLLRVSFVLFSKRLVSTRREESFYGATRKSFSRNL